MDHEKTNNTRGVYKRTEFEMYAFWKFLPSQLRGQPKQVFEKLGILDDQVFELAQIMSQKEFAEKYGIKDEGTLTDWNKKLQKENSLQYIKFWSKHLDPSVMFSQFKKIFEDPKGNDVKHWFEINDKY